MNAVAATSAGTPLWHCYGASAAAMSRPQRRAILEGTYGFRCACRDCVNGSEEEDAELTGLRCPFTPGCTGSVLVPTRLPARLTSAWEVPAGSGVCSRCRKDGTDPAHQTSLERAVGALAGVARQVEALELHMAGLAERGAWTHPEVDEAVQSLREGLQVGGKQVAAGGVVGGECSACTPQHPWPMTGICAEPAARALITLQVT